VVRQGARLAAYFGDEPAGTLYASGPAAFFMKVSDAQLSFRGDGGLTKTLVVHQNGKDYVFDRVSPH
jgi:hypothetical protein